MVLKVLRMAVESYKNIFILLTVKYLSHDPMKHISQVCIARGAPPSVAPRLVAPITSMLPTEYLCRYSGGLREVSPALGENYLDLLISESSGIRIRVSSYIVQF